MSSEILQNIIEDLAPEKFVRFFREKNRAFAPRQEKLNQYNDENFKNGSKLGEIKFSDTEHFIICSFLANKPLSERSGKKTQYEKGKRILKDTRSDAGIFIFYDDKSGNFRFSLIYANYLGKSRDWSTFRRFTYFVSKEFTNKTFLQQIGDADFLSLENIKDTFSVEKVTKAFYTDIACWYFWAMDKVEFPDDEDKNREIRNAKNLIRLITRIIFVWFMKVKKLIPETLFDRNFVDKILNYKDKTGSTYYKTILQNLFFATLNTQMKKDDPKSRAFIDEAKKKDYISDGYLQQGYYRYNRFIKDINLFLEQFKNIPFLNGGLFDCLDKRVGSKEIRIDCFSDNKKNEGRLKIPDELFFSEKEREIDLRKHLDPDSKNRIIKKVRGLMPILKSYNFTIDENTPVDEEIALDPELLGKVFENLLASYNPETKTTARKATGSYYTPREIVEYMVDESLIAYLKTALSDSTKDLEDKLRSLLDYNIETNPFENGKEATQKIIGAIEKIKILDPACGSGAFPMGILHKLVLILHKLDSDNRYWKKLLIEKVPVEIREETEQSLKNKPLDYIRKLGLIEHCIYGVDIQEIAIQISKLRFFISLLVEQEPDDNKPNNDIKSLPNLETKFVAANTLIGLDKLPEELFDSEVSKIIKELFKIRKDFFYANSRWKKKQLEEKEKKLKETLIESMQRSLEIKNKKRIQELKIEIERLNKELDNLAGKPDEIEIIEIPDLFGEKEIKEINKTQQKRQEIKRRKFICENELKKLESPGKEPSIEIAKKIADFNPYDQNKSNNWFDPEWMFGIKDGFDIVIANPPYIRQEDIKEQKPLLQTQRYEVFNSTSDIYTYFYEKGYQVLKTNGTLCFISSNKWMRAKYGEKLRNFFKANTKIINLIDFGGHKVFDATVDTNILLFQKGEPQKDYCLPYVNIDPDFTGENLAAYVQEKRQTIKQGELSDAGWTLADDKVLALKKKIEKIGTPLKDWDVNIYRGITAGFNEAFIIGNETKERLCKEDPKSAEILKPILRGRNIGKYYYKWEGLWIIFIPWHFPLHKDENIQGASKKAEEVFIKQYPVIYKHLEQYKKELSSRNKDETGIRYEWYALQRCAATYYQDFEKEKIVWAEIVQNSCFTWDIKKYFCLAKVFIMTGKECNKYLLAILNSKLGSYAIKKYYAPFLGNAAFEFKKEWVQLLPIPKIPDSEQKPFIDLVDKILAMTKDDDYPNNLTKQGKVKELEHRIDQMVYKLYGLTNEEIKIVEGA